MRALIQRVKRAAVTIEDELVSKIGVGLVVFVGVAENDTDMDAVYLANKIPDLRIFNDSQGKFNLSVQDIKGGILLVSQFTLFANTKKGRRPSFIDAAPPQKAEALFKFLVNAIKNTTIDVQTGRFQQHMLVELINDGPVTIMLDSKDKHPDLSRKLEPKETYTQNISTIMQWKDNISL